MATKVESTINLAFGIITKLESFLPMANFEIYSMEGLINLYYKKNLNEDQRYDLMIGIRSAYRHDIENIEFFGKGKVTIRIKTFQG